VPREGGLAEDGTARVFLVLLAAGLALYAVAVLLLARAPARPGLVLLVAAAVQLAPLGAPLLLSTDAWTYWDYARIATVHGGNPYVDEPQAFPQDVAFPEMGAHWRGKTSVYGPGFTLASEPLARAAGSSRDAAAWEYKTLAALAILAATVLVSRGARRPAPAAAFVGWNPLLAVHLGGGGHNDAWVALFAVAAIVLGASRRRANAAGALWVLAAAVKWVPVVFLGLHLLEARARRERLGLLGVAFAAVAVAALGTWRYGRHWLAALVPLVDNARLETRYALPHRLESAGLPHGVALGLAVAVLAVGLAWLARRALRGRARLALAACLVLLTTPYLVVWYLAWTVPLAALDEDDGLAKGLTLALCAYLLPQTIPH
jgi:hypothetical protein